MLVWWVFRRGRIYDIPYLLDVYYTSWTVVCQVTVNHRYTGHKLTPMNTDCRGDYGNGCLLGEGRGVILDEGWLKLMNELERKVEESACTVIPEKAGVIIAVR